MSEKDEMEEKIAELREEFGGLLDEESLRNLALDELGMLVMNKKKIIDMKDKEAVSLEVRVSKIYEIREFARKDGSTGKVRNVVIEDETGSCRLVLWDDDADLPEILGIADGDQLELRNCYVKFSDYGVDISRGRTGHIEKIQ
jgi:replication factor A1